MGVPARRGAFRHCLGEYPLRMVDPIRLAPDSEPQGRCVCGEKVTITDAQAVTLPNGRAGWQGFCPECGAPLFAIRRGGGPARAQ